MPVEPIAVPAVKFQHVHGDIVGPLPVTSQGYSCVLTIIDRTSRWPEAVPMSSITAEKCADSFVEGWVARYGVPHTVTMDRGTQFTSAAWSCLASTLGFRHVMTTAYHPQANGMVKRLHRQLKEALRARQCGSAWAEHIPWALLGVRAAPKDDSGVSAAEVMFGMPLNLPGEVLEKPGSGGEAERPAGLPVRPRSYAKDVKGPAGQIGAARYVYVRRGPAEGPLAPHYDGPYEVLERSDKVLLQIGGKVESVSADRLKPYVGVRMREPACRPRQGRPPGTSGHGQPPQHTAESGGAWCSGSGEKSGKKD
jgi:Integrase core domain